MKLLTLLSPNLEDKSQIIPNLLSSLPWHVPKLPQTYECQANKTFFLSTEFICWDARSDPTLFVIVVSLLPFCVSFNHISAISFPPLMTFLSAA